MTLATLTLLTLTAASAPLPGSTTGGTTLRGPTGTIALATRLSAPALASTPGASARAFVLAHGASLGLSYAHELELMLDVPPGQVGTVVFRRRFDGLPVFESHVAVGVRADGGIHAVVSSGPLPTRARPFVLSEADARQAALARLPGEVLRLERGWARGGEVLEPAFQVTVVAQDPYRSHLFMVNGATGAIGASFPRLMSAKGPVYRVSPSKPYATKTPAEACPTDTGANGHVRHQTCAPVEQVELLGLAPDAGTLTGNPAPGVGRTSVYNCRGGTTYTTTACGQSLRANAQGDFIPTKTDDFGANAQDAMSELMAYYHVDKMSRWLDTLDPTFKGLPLIRGFTNAYTAGLFGGGPMDNAFYDPSAKIMVFGQGSTVDFAYDGEVVYHEMVHAASDAIGVAVGRENSLVPLVSKYGLFVDPFSLNEGNADTFAFMAPGVDDPALGEFDARGTVNLGGQQIPIGPRGFIRNLGPGSFKTCQGDGTGKNPGRVGESHDDGELWGQFTWEVHEGLKALPGASAAPPMFKAMQAIIAAPGEQQSFNAFAKLLESNVRAMYGEKAGDYVACLAERRELARCDEPAVTVYSGEGPSREPGQNVFNMWKAFYYSQAEVYQGLPPSGFEGVPAAHQWKVTVPPGATSLRISVCDVTPAGLLSSGGRGRLFIQKGKPVELTVTGSGAQADWSFPVRATWTANYIDCGLPTSQNQTAPTQSTTVTLSATGCEGCLSTKPTDEKLPLSPGDWYILAANMGSSASFVTLKTELAATSADVIPKRPAVAPKTCSLDGIAADGGTPDAGSAGDAGVTADAGQVADGGSGGGGTGGGDPAGGGGGSGEGPGGSTANARGDEIGAGCSCNGGGGAPPFLGLLFLLGLAVLGRRRRAVS